MHVSTNTGVVELYTLRTSLTINAIMNRMCSTVIAKYISLI